MNRIRISKNGSVRATGWGSKRTPFRALSGTMPKNKVVEDLVFSFSDDLGVELDDRPEPCVGGCEGTFSGTLVSGDELGTLL